jgi:singapore isolate B (sub-type 7) whole genome shotgun sequence assembly, scaffold_3
MMDGIRVCYGKEFYDDIEKVKYEGCYYEGKRFGKGVLYDRNGGIEYDGLWKEDK